MGDTLWTPSSARVGTSRLAVWSEELLEQGEIPEFSYAALHAWSLKERDVFWRRVFDMMEPTHEGSPSRVREGGGEGCRPGTLWFPDARFNIAREMLKGERAPSAAPLHSGSPAIVWANENGVQGRLGWEALRAQVGALQHTLKIHGIGAGDVVAAYMPNRPETVILMLAAAGLGATFTSCSPDFGVKGALDRFGQVEPKAFLYAESYLYAGKTHDVRAKAQEVIAGLPTLKLVLQVTSEGVVPVGVRPGAQRSEHRTDNRRQDPVAISWHDAISQQSSPVFTNLHFNHPLYILYSSGTTGKPKCLIHSAGGVFLAHAKEHLLHGDLRENDTLFFYTTCGWMMWNWLVGGLLAGTTIVLYDGSPLHPDPGVLWRLKEEVGITHFGISPKYLTSVIKAGYEPVKHHRFDGLRTIYSTGSPLLPEHYDFIYTKTSPLARDPDKGIQLSSISGGTDIVGCFMLGNPLGSVRTGEIQGPGLGLDVAAVDEAGREVTGQKGELVCRNSFPNMPLGFWNDADGTKYRKAYFERFPGMWHHGDFIERTAEGGVVVYGRSDDVLNPGGVRIGTAEIYALVESLDFVQDSLVVGLPKDGDVDVVLFVVTKGELSAERVEVLRKTIRAGATPRHVPARIHSVKAIPRTISGKKVERAVLKVLSGEPLTNLEALANPEVLGEYASYA
ncbi:MAG: acetoacetate--CoA ligase [Planctomycetota bacterium]